MELPSIAVEQNQYEQVVLTKSQMQKLVRQLIDAKGRVFVGKDNPRTKGNTYAITTETGELIAGGWTFYEALTKAKGK